jgi:integrase/recombinase XerD
LHSYLRFRDVSGGGKVEALLAAAPTVAKWRVDTVPKHLTTDEVAGLLGAIDEHNPIGRRDYALAHCLPDMGLRVSEVAAIQLDDLNWREGTLTITHGESRRSDVLPLPVTTGRAIVQYVRGARPPTKSRALFDPPGFWPLRFGCPLHWHKCCRIATLYGCGAPVPA